MQVRLGIVGLGHMGMVHLKKALARKDVEIVAVIEKDSRKLHLVRDEFNMKTYDDYTKVDLELDCVVIATPATTHYEITKFYLQRGIHVFVEKPLAVKYEEAFELVKIAEKKKLKLQVGHIERFNPALKEGLKYIDHPLYIEAIRLSPFSGRCLDVDVVFDLMIHDLDIISTLKKESPEKIDAFGFSFVSDRIDEASAIIRFSDGTESYLSASRVSHRKERTLKIFDGKKIVIMDLLDMSISLATKNGYAVNFKTYSCEKKDLVEEEIENFILSVKGEENPFVEGKDTLPSLFFAEKILESICGIRKGI
ncbi:MAG: Gfo/Idh/MocA family oxidoreductase [Desulfobacterota bacterium]|nr:Gfo/Idh/MocA family oxidoreductase [Thermodesulfobacteriota bacterium]MDW8002044.1 Gfo/Idh/MocA family oxidoreductase [Deltaproteobacteria bacterium]